MINAEFESRAVGGPLAGVKLTASFDWPGFIQGYGEGRYVWSAVEQKWCWDGPEVEPRKPRDKQARIRGKK